MPCATPRIELCAARTPDHTVYIGSDEHAPKHCATSFMHVLNTFGQDKMLLGVAFP